MWVGGLHGCAGCTHVIQSEGTIRAAACHNLAGGEGTTGMLVVDSVVPGGPADGLLEPGDVLVRLQGQVVVHFLPMEALLDGHAGQRVTAEVERGGQLLSRSIQVRAIGM